MKQLVFSPIDESYAVSYLTNLIGDNENLSIYEIKSKVGSGDWNPGLCDQAKAAGFNDEYIETTLPAMKLFAKNSAMNLRVYSGSDLEVNLNTSLANFLSFKVQGGYAAIIDHDAETLDLQLPFGSVVTALTPTFRTTNGATVIDANDDPVLSGNQEFDLTTAVDLTVVSYDGSVTKTYTWTAEVAQS